MAELFHDTLFARTVRALLGPTYFSHVDEINRPQASVYRKGIKKQESSETTFGPTSEATLGLASRSTLAIAPTAGAVHGLTSKSTLVIAPTPETTLGLASKTTLPIELAPGTTFGPAKEDHNDPMNARGRGFGAYDAQEAHAADSEDTLSPGELQKAAKEEGADSFLVTWYGPDDPENPMNWSQFKKCWVMFQVYLLTFSVYFGAAVYTAGFTDVSRRFHISNVSATVGLTVFLLGCGTGPMLWSPLSEMPYIGRMPIYWFTLFLSVALQVPTALATNLGMLLAFRFLTGFVGSPVLATGGATVADIYSPKKRVYGITLWGAFAVCAPATAPIVGGFAVHAKSWRWTIWELVWLGGFTLVFLFFFFPETSSSNILYRRAKRVRKATGDDRLKSQSEIEAENLSGRDIIVDVLVRPFTLNFQEPIVLVLNLYIALIYAVFYLWFESFPIVFIGIYHFKEQLLGLAFLGLLGGVVATVPPYFYYIYHVEEKMYDENGQIKPEKRMPIAIFASFLAPISLLWFGWTARSSIHWIVPILGSSIYPSSSLLLFNVVLNYLADAYPRHAASVLAGNDLMRSSFAAGFPLFGAAMNHNLGVGWASTLLALLSCAFIPIPILLYFYGERIRLASKRALHH